MKTVKIFCAGVAGDLCQNSVRRYEEKYQDTICNLSIGGSNAGINRLLAGENFDVMILADSSNIDQMMIPDHTDGYFIWGGNEMVIMGHHITAENWPQKLLDPSTQICHACPYDDPGGYRAVMALQLADNVENGLSEKLFNHPNYKGLDKEEYKEGFQAVRKQETGRYHILYRSIPVSLGVNFACLPPQMNLGDPGFEDLYQSAEFEIESGEKIIGTAILHALTIPKRAQNRTGAMDFVDIFLDTEFSHYGFTNIQKVVGTFR